jgi:hypothetical protein
MRAVLDLFHHGYTTADYRLLLRDPAWARFCAQYTLERVGSWTLLAAITVLAFNAGGSGAAALAIIALVLPRAALTWSNLPSAAITDGWWVHALRVPLALVLLFASFDPQPLLLVALIVPLGALNTLADRTSAARAALENPAVAGAFLGRVEQLSVVLGSLLAAIMLVVWDATVALGVTTALFALAALLAAPLFGSQSDTGARVASGARRPNRAALHTRALLLVALGLFAGALAAMTVRVALAELVIDNLGHAEAVYALLIAAVGAGALVGPLSMPKLLGHLPAHLTIMLISIALGGGLIFLSLGVPAFVVALVLFAIGLLSVTLDLVAGTVARRLIPAEELERTLPLLTNTVLIGQLAGLVAVLALSQFMSAGDVLLTVGTLCVLAPAALLIVIWGRRDAITVR